MFPPSIAARQQSGQTASDRVGSPLQEPSSEPSEDHSSSVTDQIRAFCLTRTRRVSLLTEELSQRWKPYFSGEHFNEQNVLYINIKSSRKYKIKRACWRASVSRGSNRQTAKPEESFISLVGILIALRPQSLSEILRDEKNPLRLLEHNAGADEWWDLLRTITHPYAEDGV